ncbi:GAF domain-containing protein [Yimella sp. cx-573]|nr:GAF domain-containing protein [Yimella sp. cx-573]
MSIPRATPAVRVPDDLRQKVADLARLHERWAATRVVPELLRPEVARAWARLDPEHAPAKSQQLLAGPEVRRRRESARVLAEATAKVQQLLLDTATDSLNELVVCDADGVVLWVDGAPVVRRQSEQLGFVEGARWTEGAVGVNALGTALAEGRPIQLFGPEHSNPDQHRWVCTGAPVRDPATTKIIGAITMSGPLASAHPHTLTLVAHAVSAVESELAARHRVSLDVLADKATDADLVLDVNGWVAAARSRHAPERVWTPRGLTEGRVWLPTLGMFECSALPGGWSLRSLPDGQMASLHLITHPRALLEVSSDASTSTISLTPQHASIVRALALAPDGLSAAQLQDQLGLGSVVSVRAEVSRLRRLLGELLESRPYRLTAPCAVD